MSAPPIRLMSWNIHGGIGLDRRCDLDRTLAVVARHSPDIAALQEIDGRTHLGRRERAFEYFGERLGPHVAEARTIPRPNRDHGHLLWSRWPILAQEVAWLPGGGREKRAVIDALIDTPQGTLRVMATHFGLLPRARSVQSRFLAERAARSPEPVIVLGDFNDWRLAGSVHREIGAVLPVRATLRTWPSPWPLVRMDRVYASAGVALLDVRTDEDARGASDHLPVLADVRIAGN